MYKHLFICRNFIEVHGRPAAPTFLTTPQAVADSGGDQHYYTLHWSTVSHYPLLEYRILYKKVNNYSIILCTGQQSATTRY